MGTYFILADQITELAEQLDKTGQLQKLFQQAHTQTAKRSEEVCKEKTSSTEEGQASK